MTELARNCRKRVCANSKPPKGKGGIGALTAFGAVIAHNPPITLRGWRAIAARLRSETLKWGLVLGWVGVVGVVGMGVAYGHIDGFPPEHPYTQWAERQVNTQGRSCCGAGDGQTLTDDEWRVGPRGAYQVLLIGKWRDVEPRDALRASASDPNPTGQAVVWWNRSTYEAWVAHGETGEFNPFVYCFAPGEMM